MIKNNNFDTRKEIIKVCKLMADKNLVAGTEGNISSRVLDGNIIMTPSGYNKKDITEDMLVEVDIEGNVISGDLKPTSEINMHLGFYKKRSKVMGVVHGHPIYMTAFAASGEHLPDNILPEIVALIGRIVTVPYDTPSSIKLANILEPFVKKHNVFILQNHGAVAVGRSVQDAYHRLQVSESYANIVWAAKTLGGVKPISTEKINELLDMVKPSYE